MLRELAILAVAGAAGTVSRYALSGWAYKALGERFAWGTLTVNIIGCFLLGALLQIGLTTDLVPRELRLGLGVGFLGAFTTYSTFSYETVRYLEEGAWWTAGGNIAANLVIGIVATLAGLAVARAAFGGA